MLLDANLLLLAVDRANPWQPAASRWLESVLNGDQRVGLPWQTIGGFTRIVTHPRIAREPLEPEAAWAHVEAWLAQPVVWIPPATERTAAVLARLLARTPVAGDLLPDAQLGALAVEHGLVVQTTDGDFSRFPEVRWHNPLRPRAR